MNELMLAMFAGTGGFLGIMSLITIGLDIDSPKKLLFIEWLVLIVTAVLCLAEKGLGVL